MKLFPLYFSAVILFMTTDGLDLGTTLSFMKCGEIGRNCGIHRDKVDNPTKVIMRPCCKHLYCVGAGPLELKNNAGGAYGSSDKVVTGICSLNLDNNQGPKDKDEYLKYVANL